MPQHYPYPHSNTNDIWWWTYDSLTITRRCTGCPNVRTREIHQTGNYDFNVRGECKDCVERRNEERHQALMVWLRKSAEGCAPDAGPASLICSYL